jgi:Polyketide cyclase / dehydrase and lipid transport
MVTVRSAQATRLVPAPAAEIFELLASPAQHPVIDGSGMVRGVQEGTPVRLSLGAKFGMQMQAGPAPYKILNEVVEFQEDRRIAWRHFGGHIWRYTLEPVDEQATQVTEEFDPSATRSPLMLLLMRATARNQRSIDRTLDRLVAWAGDPSRAQAG